MGRHLVDVSLEEARVVLTGLFRQRHDMCLFRERRARLIESDVAVCADAQHLNIHAVVFHGLLICLAVRLGVSIRHMHVFFLDIDALEQVLMHERPVRLFVVAVNAYIFIEVECHDIGIARSVFFMILDHVLVQSDRAASCGKAQHRRLLGSHDLLHHLKRFFTDCVVVFYNNYFHVISSYC